MTQGLTPVVEVFRTLNQYMIQTMYITTRMDLIINPVQSVGGGGRGGECSL